MGRTRRYVALVNGGKGWEILSSIYPVTRVYSERISDLFSALESAGYSDWNSIGPDPKLEAELALTTLPYPLQDLDIGDGVVVYAGPTKLAEGRVIRSAILELHPPALERLGYLVPHSCPVEGCNGRIRVPRSITPDIYTCPCGHSRIFVRLPKYGEHVKEGEVFILEVVR